MKKEYLILTALILILCAYLFLHKENRDNYTLPEIPEIDIEKVTGMVIKKENVSIVFTKSKDKWTLTDKGYAADKYTMDNMLATFKNFKLAALVSQDGDVARYELDEKKKISVELLEGEKTVFKIAMGKTAPSFNHTFVMLENDKQIYHASGSFRSNFDNSVDDFRDKTVMEFKTGSIKHITVEKDNLTTSLNATEEKNDKDQNVVTWASKEKSPADKKLVSALLSAMSNLECEKFLDIKIDEQIKKAAPMCKVHLENETGLDLTLFAAAEGENIIGISSMSEYVFALSQYNGKEIITTIEKLLGIYTTEDKKE